MTELAATPDQPIPLAPAAASSATPLPELETIPVKGISVDILPEGVRVHVGNGVRKMISMPHFLEAISATLAEVDATNQDSWVLPRGTYFFQTSRHEVKLALHFQEGVHELTFMTSKKKRVTPNIVITISLTKASKGGWVVNTVRYYCTPLRYEELDRNCWPERSDTKKIYTLALGNIYENSTMCYGSNDVIRQLPGTDLSALYTYYTMIFDSPFNADLSVQSVSGDYRSPRDWFDKLAILAEKGKPFPYELLR